MTEYYTIKSIDNSRLVRTMEPVRLRDFWRRAVAGGAIAGCLLFYTWQHFECIQLRYKLEQLDAQRAQAAELRQQLRLEVATLRSPMRVDAIARDMGLTVPVPGQVAPIQGASDAVLAEASMAVQMPRP